MSDSLEIELKNEIDDIAGRIDTIMKKIEELTPETKEEKPQEEQVPEDQVSEDQAQIIGEEKDIFEGPF